MIAAGPDTDIHKEVNVKKPCLNLETEHFGHVMRIDQFGRR
jgi:hypothetical protein